MEASDTRKVRVDHVMDAAMGGIPNPRRLQAIAYGYRHAVTAFQTSGAGDTPTLEFLCSDVRLETHPDVAANVVSMKDGLLCFFAMWGVPLDQLVGVNLFTQYFADWSCAFTSDNGFLQFFYGLWGIDPAAVAKELEDSAAVMMLAPTRAASDAIFNSIDCNKNGELSLAELDLAVIRLWPQYNAKPAIMRAYKLADTSGNGWLEKPEFFNFCHYLVQYCRLLAAFKALDTDGSGTVTLAELLRGKHLVGLSDESDVTLRKIFKEMDKNNGGQIVFEEFCVAMAKRRGDAELARFTNRF